MKINEIPNNLMGIYKITFPNDKIYIGLSINIKRRMREHNSPSQQKTPCDKAINLYGKIEEVEILETISDITLLEEREKYWIKYFKSNNKENGYNLTEGGDGSNREGVYNCNAVFTDEQVYDIRQRRFLKERKCDVYKNYIIFSFGSFEKIWLGHGYPTVGQEFIIPCNSISRSIYSSLANSGENNNQAKLTEEEVKKIRLRYDGGESPASIYEDYEHYLSINTIKRVCYRQTWRSIK